MNTNGIPAELVRKSIIEPALKHISAYSPAAAELVLFTMAAESLLGHYQVQMGNGPAKGLPQMEDATHDDIWANFLKFRPELASKLVQLVPPPLRGDGNVPVPAHALVSCALYAAAMCRIHYMRVAESLPSTGDTLAMARYWKKHYNTIKGRGTVNEAVEKFNRLCLA